MATSFRGWLLGVIVLLICTKVIAQEKGTPAEAPSAAQLKSLAVQVQAGLVADRVLGVLPITPKVEKDVVVLEGTVPTEQERDRISRVAAREAGKLGPLVVNRIRVKAVEVEAATKTTSDEPQSAVPTKLDQDQLAKLREVIAEAMPDLDKRINLVFRLEPIPTIVVEGVLTTYDEKLALNRLIRQNYRGLAILNNVRVHMKPETPATAPAEESTVVVAPSEKLAITVDKDTPHKDRKLAEKVAQTLRQDKRMVDVAIVVQADHDVIWLRGSVQSEQQRVQAIAKSDAVLDVEYVIDDLKVDPAPSPNREEAGLDDEDVTAYVRTYFAQRVGVSVVDVKAGPETVIVVVDDSFLGPQERQAAERQASDLEKSLGRQVKLEVQKRR
jgi:osmotically-inducible protein OsmY